MGKYESLQDTIKVTSDNGNVTDKIESVQATTKDTFDDQNVMDKIESVQATTKGTNEDGNVTDKKDSVQKYILLPSANLNLSKHATTNGTDEKRKSTEQDTFESIGDSRD